MMKPFDQPTDIPSKVLHAAATLASRLRVLLIASLVLAPAPSWGQLPLNGPLDQISTNPQVIRAQIQLGAKLADEAIAILETTDDPQELEKANDLVKKSYVYLRYAWYGCQKRQYNASVFENRSIVIAMDNINAARNGDVAAGFPIANSIPWPETRAQLVSEALEHLRPVPQLAQRALPFVR